MDFFVILFASIVIILLYLNVVEHYKKGIELEIYEMDYDNPYELQKVIKKKQPVLFEFRNRVLEPNHVLNRITLEGLAKKYGKEKVHIANIKDISTLIKPVSLRLEKAVDLIRADNEVAYLSCNNSEMIADTSLEKYAESLDEYVQPSFTVSKKRDFVFGSPSATTPLAYHENHSAFLYVVRGQITIKMTPFRNEKYMKKPFQKMDGKTASLNTDLWTANKVSEEVSALEFQVSEGWFLYIPPYWWYTVRIDNAAISETATIDTMFLTSHYTTLMNMVIQVPEMAISQWLPLINTTVKNVTGGFVDLGFGDDGIGEKKKAKPVVQSVDVEQAMMPEESLPLSENENEAQQPQYNPSVTE